MHLYETVPSEEVIFVPSSEGTKREQMQMVISYKHRTYMKFYIYTGNNKNCSRCINTVQQISVLAKQAGHSRLTSPWQSKAKL